MVADSGSTAVEVWFGKGRRRGGQQGEAQPLLLNGGAPRLQSSQGALEGGVEPRSGRAAARKDIELPLCLQRQSQSAAAARWEHPRQDPDLGVRPLAVDSPTATKVSLMLGTQCTMAEGWCGSIGDIQAAFLNGVEAPRSLCFRQPPRGLPGWRKASSSRSSKVCLGWCEKLVAGGEIRFEQNLVDACISTRATPDKAKPAARQASAGPPKTKPTSPPADS